MNNAFQEKWVPEDKAMEILGCSKATLKRYVRDQHLDVTRYDRGKIRVYPLDQLLTLKTVSKRDLLTGFSLQERMNIMASETQNLARKVRLIAEAIGLPHLYHSWSDQVLSAMYDTALLQKGEYKSKRPTLTFLSQWLATVPRLTDSEYRRLAGLYPEDEHPWRIFYIVTEELITSIRIHFNLQIDKEMARQQQRLELALDRIRSAALVQLAVENARTDPKRMFATLLQNPIRDDDAQAELDGLALSTDDGIVDLDAAVAEMYDTSQSSKATPDRALHMLGPRQRSGQRQKGQRTGE